MQDDITVYYITGKQFGPLSVPQSWCEECDLTVRAVRSAVEEMDPGKTFTVAVKPWLRHALPALARGAWHPPVVIIDGEIFSQGVVPDRQALRERIGAVLARKHSPVAGPAG